MNWLFTLEGSDATNGASAASGQVTTQVMADVRVPRAKERAKKKTPAWEKASDVADEVYQDRILNGVQSAHHGPDLDVGHEGAHHDTGESYKEGAGNTLDAIQAQTGHKMILKSYEEVVLKNQDAEPVLVELDDEDPEEQGNQSTSSSSDDEEESKARAFDEKLAKQKRALQEEISETEDKLERQKVAMVRGAKAARTIQRIVRLRHNYKTQCMQLYKQAEEQGRDTLWREKKLLVWTAIFALLEKFDERLHYPHIMERLNLKVLKNLPPPPPPPPKGEPPTDDDKELHKRYEQHKTSYKSAWVREAQITMGPDKFQEMLKGQSFAEKQKKLVAKIQMRKAKEALSEQEFQDCLKKAWRLTNDWQPVKDFEPKEFLNTNKEALAAIDNDRSAGGGGVGGAAGVGGGAGETNTLDV